MAVNYPTSLDTFTNPTAGDYLDSPAVLHTAQHGNLNDAVEELEKKVGITNSADTTSHEYKINKFSGGEANYVPKKNTATAYDVTWKFESEYSLDDTIAPVGGTLTIDFSGASLQSCTISGSTPNLTIATTNRAAGRSICVRIVNSSGGAITLAGNGQKILGSALPALADTKEAQITLTCWDASGEAGVHLAYAETV